MVAVVCLLAGTAAWAAIRPPPTPQGEHPRWWLCSGGCIDVASVAHTRRGVSFDMLNNNAPRKVLLWTLGPGVSRSYVAHVYVDCESMEWYEPEIYGFRDYSARGERKRLRGYSVGGYQPGAAVGATALLREAGFLISPQSGAGLGRGSPAADVVARFACARWRQAQGRAAFSKDAFVRLDDAVSFSSRLDMNSVVQADDQVFFAVEHRFGTAVDLEPRHASSARSNSRADCATRELTTLAFNFFEGDDPVGEPIGRTAASGLPAGQVIDGATTDSFAAALLCSALMPDVAPRSRFERMKGADVPSGAKFAPPKAVRTVPPEWPNVANGTHLVGAVRVGLIVGADGTLRDAAVITTSGLSHLDATAIDLVRHGYVYSPATVDGRPVDATHELDIEFRRN